MSAVSVRFANRAECEFPDLIARIAQGDQHAMDRLHEESKQALTIYVWKILRDNCNRGYKPKPREFLKPLCFNKLIESSIKLK
jgi:hypothetical protein